jgi:hypothetical protein
MIGDHRGRRHRRRLWLDGTGVRRGLQRHRQIDRAGMRGKSLPAAVIGARGRLADRCGKAGERGGERCGGAEQDETHGRLRAVIAWTLTLFRQADECR